MVFNKNASNPADVDNAQKLETPVLGPGDVNCILTYSGTVVLDWRQPDIPSEDTAQLNLILDDQFGGQYTAPATDFEFTTFLSVASEFSQTRPPLGHNNDWDFEIHQASTAVVDKGNNIKALTTTATLTNDEDGSFNRIAYQVTVSVIKNSAPDLRPFGCTHLKDYEGGFAPVLVDTDPTQIQNASTLEFVLDPSAPSGANRLLVFSGTALVGFRPTDDDVLTKGTVSIQFIRNLLDPTNLKQAAVSANLSSIFNLDTGNDTTYAVDCAQLSVGQFQEPSGATIAVPMLTAALVIQGAGGKAGISSISYLASAHVFVPFQVLVSAVSGGGPPNFQPAVSLRSGSAWQFKLILPSLGPAHVALDTPGNHPLVPQPAPAAVGAAAVFVSAPQKTTLFHGPPRSVLVTATLGMLHAQGTLNLDGVG